MEIMILHITKSTCRRCPYDHRGLAEILATRRGGAKQVAVSFTKEMRNMAWNIFEVFKFVCNCRARSRIFAER